MKKTIAIALAAAGLVSGTWLYANHPGKDGGHLEKRMGHLKSELNLTADQEAKIREIFQKQKEKMEALREETRKSVSSVLTAEQKQKFEEMKERRQERKDRKFKD